jgi:triosephosphate isomerase
MMMMLWPRRVHKAVLLLLLLCILLPPVVESSSSSIIKKKKLYLGCNWKCALETTREVDELCDNLNNMWKSLSELEKSKVELCVNPPYVYLDRVRRRLTREISLGGQNVFDARGPNVGNTGTTTAAMLKSLGCSSVLLGHSDRRNNLFETDRLISDKVNKALSAGLGVTLTIGELPHQRRSGLALLTLRKQLRAAIGGIDPDEWNRIVIAYEPVWAVGEGATPCSPREAQRIGSYLRRLISESVGADAAAACRLTYTGSVDETNAAEYASLEDVEGFVVGRAGLDAARLRSIIRTLANSSE